MSGIFGIWNLDGRPLDPGALGRMSTMLRHRGACAGRVDADRCLGVASLARTDPETTRHADLVAADTTGSLLVFDGRLDDRDDLRAVVDPKHPVATDASDAALALAAYRAFGEDFAARLNGDFALALFDPRLRQLLLARDAIGVRPLYYYAGRDLFLFASEIKALLANPGIETGANDDVLAGFLLTRFAGLEAQPETCFRNILSVLPGQLLVARREGVRTRRYWDFDVTRQLRLPRFEDYAAAFRERFEQAVRRRLRSAFPVAVSVSGGLDSSAILCMAETVRRSEPGIHPSLVGVASVYEDGAPADEKAFLPCIEREYTIDITRLRNLPAGIMDECGLAIWHGEVPSLGGQWNATHASMSAVRGLGAGVLLTGHWGDQFLFDDAYLIDLCRKGSWREAWLHVNEYARWVDVPARTVRRRFFSALVKHYVPPGIVSIGRRVRRRLRRASEAEVWYTDRFRRRGRQGVRARPRSSSGSAHARSLYAEARSQYGVFCMEWNNKIAAMHGLEMAFPFLDRDLIAFLMAIPGDMQSARGVHKGIFREALRGVLPPSIRARVSKADFTSEVNRGFREEYNRLVRSLPPDALVASRGYVDRACLREIGTHKRTDRTCETSWALGDLFSLELWLRQFSIDGSSPQRSAQTP
jgi:asparagine synthase (glutamine-hydrolysing)